ncbi:hypothetical protein [Granulicoccus phenolivorans]|uniref:hypothetical protein n=1 Tax=Granulicoccus phenolivorans TaxID=266854 RepID=UPI00040C5F34|nr:hypothetical protein [Granulicoccus phenolivorans]
MPLPVVIQDWMTADRAKDLPRMRDLLAEQVELISPLTDQFTFSGRREVSGVYEAIFTDLSEIEFVNTTGADRDWVLHGRNTFRGRNLEEIQWLQLDEHDLIEQITLFLRPAPAAIAVLATIGRRLHANGIMARPAAVASAAAVPVSIGLTGIERFLMPRLGPHHRRQPRE